MGNIAKIQKGIKRKAVSASPQTTITPAIKQSPKTPESRKIPKFSFKTGSKGKRLLPKTPKKKKSSSSAYKTPQKRAEKSSKELAVELPFVYMVSEMPWKSPSEIARESIRKIRRKTLQSRSKERKEIGLQKSALKEATKRALKKTCPQPLIGNHLELPQNEN